MRARTSTLLLVLALVGLSLAGCGDEPDPQQEVPDPGWSDPATGGAAATPHEGGSTAPAAKLLGHLRARVAAGAGPGTDRAFGSDVEAVVLVIWGPSSDRGPDPAAHVHAQLATIAGDVARSLKADPRAPVDATEKRIHAAWLAAAAGSPEAYATWCAKEGAALLKAREEALRARLFK